jgi:hypothetical protein
VGKESDSRSNPTFRIHPHLSFFYLSLLLPLFLRYYVNQILQLGEEGIASAWSRVRK